MSGVKAVYAEKSVDEKLSILEFCRRAIDWVRENEIEKIVLITAGPFVPRLLRDLSYLAKENNLILNIEIAERIVDTDERTWFSESAWEEWTRKIEKCRVREKRFLKIPWFLYKRMKI
jgi:2-hydroxy-3-keto-5-methylthiopentenyl-1-phosphate phosphatase